MRPHHYATVFVLAAAALAPRYALSQQSRTTLDSTIVGPAVFHGVWTRRNGQWQVVSRSDMPVQQAKSK